ncbi:hypothetical protein ACS127_14075 [Amphibacillus sp. Q70]|uniref:hypothetical protein n=1 Tax=Amphibacillus sp. Q70 TaxID=3453416 RepID=UPI003F86F2B5
MLKKKHFFFLSIGLNILLISILIWGSIKFNHVTDKVVVESVHSNLIELEDIISLQKDENWPQPGVVASKINDLNTGLLLSAAVGTELDTISKNDLASIQDLSAGFIEDQHHPAYIRDGFSDQAIEYYNQFGAILSELEIKENASETSNTADTLKLLNQLRIEFEKNRVYFDYNRWNIEAENNS